MGGAKHRSPARGRIPAALGAVLLAGSVAAGETAGAFETQVWINPGIYSYHFDRNKNLRDDNIGLGGEVLFADDHAAMAGTFINSNRQRSHYAAYLWRPLHWTIAGTHVSAGVAAGAFDGYPNYKNGAWFAAAMPLLSVEGGRFGANFAVVPTIANRLDGAFAVQLKFRIW
jgi:hypothetical protein